MIDLMIADEKLIKELLEYCTGITIQFIKLMAQTGCDMVSNGDSPAGPSMISADMYEEYALPYEKKVVESAHKEGLPYALHICGDTSIILDKMTLSGADAYELDYKTSSLKVYEALHNRAVLIGNIDPSGVLTLGKPEDVRKAVSDLLEVYRDSDRFILNAGCAIPPIAPSENIRTLINTARDFR
jgi:MtaA/CmuA family methyltransferase